MKKLLTTVAMLVAFGGGAVAQQVCMPHESMAEVLSGYGERPHVRMMSPSGVVVEIWGDEDDGSWTFIFTDVTGKSCSFDAGFDFEVIPAPEAPAVGDPA